MHKLFIGFTLLRLQCGFSPSITLNKCHQCHLFATKKLQETFRVMRWRDCKVICWHFFLINSSDILQDIQCFFLFTMNKKPTDRLGNAPMKIDRLLELLLLILICCHLLLLASTVTARYPADYGIVSAILEREIIYRKLDFFCFSHAENVNMISL